MIDRLVSQTGNKCVAIGECGLDYQRLNHSQKHIQKIIFKKHFELAEEFKLPMYFLSRDAHPDFVEIIRDHK